MPRFFSHPVQSIRRRKQSFRSRKGNKKSHKRSNKRSHTRKQQGGISEEPYQSHKIDITFGRGQIFTFYTDSRTDRIRDIKTELLRKEEFAGKTLETIVLSDLNGVGAVRNNDELITEPLNLRMDIGSHLLGAFRNIKNKMLDYTIISLPTQRERDAYEHAVNGTEDDVYTYTFIEGNIAFMFYDRQEKQANKLALPKFAITNETSRRLGYSVIQFYDKEKSWYTVRSPYANANIARSDAGACRIFKNYRTPGQRIALDNDEYVYNNVNRLNDNVFTYVSSTGTIAYVVGIPNKNITTFEESKGRVLNKIQPFLY